MTKDKYEVYVHFNLPKQIKIKGQEEPQQTDEYCKRIGAELRDSRGGDLTSGITKDDQVYEALKSIFKNDYDCKNYIVKRLLEDEPTPSMNALEGESKGESEPDESKD